MKDKVIHVELLTPYLGQQHYYFGSLAAIYEVLPAGVVGIKLESLWSHMNNDEYRGRKAIIRKGAIIRKPGRRRIGSITS